MLFRHPAGKIALSASDFQPERQILPDHVEGRRKRSGGTVEQKTPAGGEALGAVFLLSHAHRAYILSEGGDAVPNSVYHIRKTIARAAADNPKIRRARSPSPEA